MRYLLLAVLLSADAVSACECSRLTECEMTGLPVIFTGKVVAGGVGSIRDDPWYKDSRSVRFEVIEALRGLTSGTKFVDVETVLLPGMCSPNPYRPGRTYLVTPRTKDGKFIDGICFTGRDVEQVGDVIDYLRRHFEDTSQTRIRGRVGAVHVAGASEILDYLLSQGEAKPLQGVTVSTSVKEKIYSAISNAEGRFELPVPNAGSYTVQAVLSPYKSASAVINFRRREACTTANFGLVSGSSISGKVWDHRGQPVPKAEVGIIDLDRPPDKERRRAAFRTAYSEQRDGGFLFENVPLGR